MNSCGPKCFQAYMRSTPVDANGHHLCWCLTCTSYVCGVLQQRMSCSSTPTSACAANTYPLAPPLPPALLCAYCTCLYTVFCPLAPMATLCLCMPVMRESTIYMRALTCLCALSLPLCHPPGRSGGSILPLPAPAFAYAHPACPSACAPRHELQALLQEERLVGATLLIFANKQDIPSALSLQELEQVCAWFASCSRTACLLQSIPHIVYSTQGHQGQSHAVASM